MRLVEQYTAGVVVVMIIVIVIVVMTMFVRVMVTVVVTALMREMMRMVMTTASDSGDGGEGYRNRRVFKRQAEICYSCVSLCFWSHTPAKSPSSHTLTPITLADVILVGKSITLSS